MRLTASQRHAARDALALDLAKQLVAEGKPVPAFGRLQRLAVPLLMRAEYDLARTGWIGPTERRPVQVRRPPRRQRIVALRDYRV